MAPHADTLHLGEQQVGEIECAGASKDVYDDSVKVADIPVQVPQTNTTQKIARRSLTRKVVPIHR
jgi:hypothetical protein